MMVWRAFHPDTADKLKTYRDLLQEDLTAPMKMELWVANADGSNRRVCFGCNKLRRVGSPKGSATILECK